MRAVKRRKLAGKGWKISGTREFLGLTDSESAFIELKLALAARLRAKRIRSGLSQTKLAARLRSSQSRVAKMEAADGSVTLDLLFRSLFALGASRSELANLIR
ncbi:MAG: hypothetical protein AUJ52_08225 [Elusimicrobia bacterium CG1_02_63_36]|nr:MAG: hypothetical protein AUJ52_08225 [Elusimicrobia bacterium CG1_02_63_36]PJA15501.1 MAG: transcriptional regulator [Elusimicrobia bacterium CG_4_10_14_0_2_um_filter_63_34]PJB25198.1 MAG: transcriptional regulator [Elusimicrobia bacterium CG_4_9_14_3_um_filter_62_55]